MPTAVAKTERHSRPQAAALKTAVFPAAASVAAPFAWPVEQWLGFQAELFKASEPFWIGWIERRCAGAAAMLDSLGKLARCDDASAAGAICTAWFGGAVERLNADVQAVNEHATAMSRWASTTAEASALLPLGEALTAGKAASPVYEGPERRSPSRPWSNLATE